MPLLFFFPKVIDKDDVIGELLCQLENYKASIERAHRLRELKELPENFDLPDFEDMIDFHGEEVVRMFALKYTVLWFCSLFMFQLSALVCICSEVNFISIYTMISRFLFSY